jgi:RHS repeat-associated protein
MVRGRPVNTASWAWQQLSVGKKATVDCHDCASAAEVYVENISLLPVWFDDLEIQAGGAPVAVVVQEVHYDPWGLELAGIGYNASGNPEHKFTYNGKEKQGQFGLGWLDYGARHYQPDIGRWGGVDALAHKYESVSPFIYCYNNPLRYVDPDGNVVRDANGNIIARVRDRNATYTSGNSQVALSFSATQVQILTNGGRSLYGYIANSKVVNSTSISENGATETMPLIGTDNSHNCTGNVLADQKMTIASNDITKSTLKGEGYTPLAEGETPQAGDITAIENGGIYTHFERYTSPNTVNSKGGVARDTGDQSPGTSFFGQEKGATTTVMRKRIEDRVTNVVNSNNSTTVNGITYVSNAVWRQIKREQRELRREEARARREESKSN